MESNDISRAATALLTVLCFLGCWKIQEALTAFELGWGSRIITSPFFNHHTRHHQHRHSLSGCRGSPGAGPAPAPAPANDNMADNFTAGEIEHVSQSPQYTLKMRKATNLNLVLQERQCLYPQPPGYNHRCGPLLLPSFSPPPLYCYRQQ